MTKVIFHARKFLADKKPYADFLFKQLRIGLESKLGFREVSSSDIEYDPKINEDRAVYSFEINNLSVQEVESKISGMEKGYSNHPGYYGAREISMEIKE